MLNLKKLAPRIYHLELESRYDLCSLFMRYQETYESSSDRFINKPFTWAEFMSWYSREFPSEGGFGYAGDWSGFNIPFDVVKQVHDRGIKDPNMYDSIMIGLYDMINVHEQNCYLIGSTPESDVLDHELVHAMFYTNKNYKSDVLKIVDKYQYEHPQLLLDICSILANEGYAEHVYFDEINAYCTTGDNSWFDEIDDVVLYNKMKRELIKLHNIYFNVNPTKKKNIKKRK